MAHTHDHHGHHGHGHGHHHHVDPESGDAKVLAAVAVNGLLTLAQLVGGIFAGSLSLIADALHNFSDAVSLGIAFGARKIARRPSDRTMTFGYVRAEVVAALINYTTLIVVGLYLVYEAIMRLFEPTTVMGWLVVIIAGVALVIDVVTALLTYAMSKSSMNIRAAFLHNVADALGSVGVIIAGTLIILFDWTIVDPLITFAIAGYILWQAFSEIGGTVRLLMLGTPPDIDTDALLKDLRSVDGVEDIHHMHVWMIDENQYALEAHVVVGNSSVASAEAVKAGVKARAQDAFGIAHTTLELEAASAPCCEGDTQAIGHPVGEAAHSH